MGETARIWIRRITWLAMAVILLVIGLIAAGRSRGLRPTVVQVSSPGGPGDELAEGRPVGVYTGFQFTESVEGRTVFVLQAERTLGMSSGWNRIENVRLLLFDEDGEQVELTCDSARFNQKTRDARLEGAVHVDLPGGGFLDSVAGRFDGTRQVFESGQGVVFSNGLLIGEAGRAVYRLGSDRLLLDGGLVVGEDTGMTLKAPSLEYSRRSGRVVFPEGWTLTSPGMSVTAPRAEVRLEGEEGAPRRLLMQGGVLFRMDDVPAESGGSLTLRAQSVRAVRDEGDLWQVRASSTGPWVELRATGLEKIEEMLVRSWELRAVVGPGGPVRAVFRGTVCLEAYPAEGLPGFGESRRLTLWFEEGRPRSFEMKRDVLLRSEGYRIRGFAARFLPADGKAIVRGDPETFQRAVVEGEELQVEANRVEIRQASGSARATGDVQGLMENTGLLGRGERAEEGPVRFAAEVLDVGRNGETLTLRRASRVWQGRQLLMADQITFEKSAEILDAVGHVRLSVPARQFNPDAGEGDEALVVSRAFHYDRRAGRAIFEGSVRFTDPRYTMSCSRMEVTIGVEDDRVEELLATGGVDIIDLVEDRRMRGDEARYGAASRQLTMTGNPVSLLDGKGNVISGTSLTWDQASGTVTVSGDTGSPTETIYHPEETPETPGT